MNKISNNIRVYNSLSAGYSQQLIVTRSRSIALGLWCDFYVRSIHGGCQRKSLQNGCKKKRKSSMRARSSPIHIHFPAENGIKASLFLKVPFSLRKCPGSNLEGFLNCLGSFKTEVKTGITTVPSDW